MSNRRKGVALAVTAAVFWGVMGIFVRNLTAAGFTGMEIAFLRCAPAGLLYFLTMLVRRPGVLKTGGKGLAVSLLYGVAAYGTSFFSYSIAVARIPIGVATVLMFMSPIWVTVLNLTVFRERVAPRKAAAIAVCMAGAVLAADLLHSGGGRIDPVGVLAGVVNGFGVALQLMIPKYFSGRYRKDTMLVYGFLGAAAFLALFTDFGKLAAGLAGPGGPALLVDILCIGVLCTMVASVAFVQSSSFVDASTTSILSALEVVVGSVTGLLLFHERLSPLQLLGAGIIVLGALGSEVTLRRKSPAS